MKLPTIHLNGSSAESLFEANAAVAEALYSALALLCDAAPNMRDYYPQGNTAFADANSEHAARVKRLQDVRHELLTVCAHIEEAKDGRFRR